MSRSFCAPRLNHYLLIAIEAWLSRGYDSLTSPEEKQRQLALVGITSLVDSRLDNSTLETR